MRRILITGSRGLVGRSLCAQLRAAGDLVFDFDSAIAKDQAGHGDVCDPVALAAAVARVDGVFHLAAVSRVNWGQQNPIQCALTNVEGTENVLTACLNAVRPPWVVVTSSREVYGQQDVRPVEESALLQPLNAYARSKLAAELSVESAQSRGLRAAYVRLSSVYGDAFDHSTRVVPAFISAALCGETLYVEGEGNSLDLTCVTDVARGLNLLGIFVEHGGQPGPLHFVSGRETSLLELARIVIRLTHSKSAIELTTRRNYDVRQFVGNAAKARSVLGWSTVTPLETGLKKLIGDFAA